MPKNKGKGGKNTKRMKDVKKEDDNTKRELVYKEPGQEYALVTKMLGNRRIETSCDDGQKRMCVIRGNMVRRTWISVGDLVLIGLRDYQDYKADVIYKYRPDEAKQLKAYNEIPGINLNETDIVNVFPGSSANEDYVQFVEDDDDDDDDDDIDIDAI